MDHDGSCVFLFHQGGYRTYGGCQTFAPGDEDRFWPDVRSARGSPGGRRRVAVSLAAWLRSARLPSQSYIALPLLLGQAAWAGAGHHLDLGVLVLVQVFGLCDQLYIVWANDYADQETDRLNTTATIFSGGSRVLVVGALAPAAVRAAAQVAALGLGLVTLGLSAGWGRPGLLPLAAAALLLLWAYSYPPIRLSYRGGGELLQAAGVGGVLPLYGWVAQGGAFADFPRPLLVAQLLASLAGALATTLPDEPSDRASHKRTAAVHLGPSVTSGILAALHAGAALVLARTTWGPPAACAAAVPWLLAPLGATLLHLASFRAGPGSRGMSLRVGLAVGATLGLQLVPAVALLP